MLPVFHLLVVIPIMSIVLISSLTIYNFCIINYLNTAYSSYTVNSFNINIDFKHFSTFFFIKIFFYIITNAKLSILFDYN